MNELAKAMMTKAMREEDPRISDLMHSMAVVESHGDGFPSGAWFHGLLVGLTLDRESARSLMAALTTHPVLGPAVEDAGAQEFAAGLKIDA